MVVFCENCSTRYRLDDATHTGKAVRITCPRCKHKFVVRPTRNPVEAKPEGRVEDLDFAKVGIATWKVKAKVGLVYDFRDYGTLQRSLKNGRISSEDALSWDGTTWVTLADIEDLGAYMVSVYKDLEAGKRPQTPARATISKASAGSAVVGGGAQVSIGGPKKPTPAKPEPPKAEPAQAAPVPAEQPPPGPRIGASPRVEGADASARSQAIVVTSGGPRGAGPKVPTPRGAPRRTAKASPDAGPSDPFEEARQRKLRKIKEKAKATRPKAKVKRDKGIGWGRVLAAVTLIGGALGLVTFTLLRSAVEPAAPVDRTTTAVYASAEIKADYAALADLAASLEVTEEELAQDYNQPDPLVIIPDSSPDPSSAIETPRERADRERERLRWKADEYAWYGIVAYRDGNFDLAVDAFTEALRLAPDEANYKLGLGASLSNTGQLVYARDMLEEALGEGTLAAHKWLGHVARDEGRPLEAVEHYEAYLKLNPVDAYQILEEIQTIRGNG